MSKCDMCKGELGRYYTSINGMEGQLCMECGTKLINNEI